MPDVFGIQLWAFLYEKTKYNDIIELRGAKKIELAGHNNLHADIDGTNTWWAGRWRRCDNRWGVNGQIYLCLFIFFINHESFPNKTNMANYDGVDELSHYIKAF